MPAHESPKRNLRLAYIVSMSHGLHSFVFREIRELVSRGSEVHIFPTRVGAGPYTPPIDWPIHRLARGGAVLSHLWMIANRPNRYGEVLLEAIRLGAFVDFLMAGAFAKTVIDLRLELIHCHFGDHKLFVGYLCGRLSERPVTVTIHAYELYRNPNPRFFRYVLARVRGIVTIAVYNRKVLQEKWGIPPARVAVIPLFADLPLEPAVAGGDKVTILTVARLVEKKGHRTLIAALARLPLEFESVVVGRGSLNVQDLAEAAGVENRVHVRGAVNDQELQMAYRSATIFCLPSEGAPDGDREGIPVALMEAMAHGLPVVGTRHAGIPELVEEMLVDEGDVDGLAKCLLILGRDPDLRKRLGRKNREIVEARFSRANVLQLESLFRGIVDADR